MAKKKHIKAGTSKASAIERREIFINTYLTNGNNGLQAAIAAGYSVKGAGVQAYRLLKEPQVQKIISEQTKKVVEATGLSVDKTLKELSKIIYFDIRTLFDKNNNLKEISDLDDIASSVVSSIEVFEEFSGKGENKKLIGYTKKIKLCDKVQALDKAMKYHGLYLGKETLADDLSNMTTVELIAKITEKLNASRH
jgi:phage terminase small subunit